MSAVVLSADLFHTCCLCSSGCECHPMSIPFTVCRPLFDSVCACQDVSATPLLSCFHLLTSFSLCLLACECCNFFILFALCQLFSCSVSASSMWVPPFICPSNCLLTFFNMFSRLWVLPLMHAVYCLLTSFLLISFVSMWVLLFVYLVCSLHFSDALSYIYKLVIFRNRKFPSSSHLLKQ